ncbi:MAG: hypothetical protein E6614_26135 [Bradyrhizobium sp.]|nr:hypothetical protein [Bradyrhizobium sp.]
MPITSAAAAAPENGAMIQGDTGRGGGGASARGGSAAAAGSSGVALSAASGAASGAAWGCDWLAAPDDPSATASAGADQGEAVGRSAALSAADGRSSREVGSRSMVGGGRFGRPVSEAGATVSGSSTMVEVPWLRQD